MPVRHRGLARRGRVSPSLAGLCFKIKTDRDVPAVHVQPRRDGLPSRSGGFKTDTFRTTTGTSARIDAASSAWNARSERRGTLRAFASNALGQPSRRLTKNFYRVRVRRTSKSAFSVQDASGDTMRTSIIISIAASSGMSSGAATIAPGAVSGSCRTFRQASAPNQKRRKSVRAQPHHATSHVVGMSTRVSRAMDCKPQRTP